MPSYRPVGWAAPLGPEHGTSARYFGMFACRCEECKAAGRDYRKADRARKEMLLRNDPAEIAKQSQTEFQERATRERERVWTFGMSFLMDQIGSEELITVEDEIERLIKARLTAMDARNTNRANFLFRQFTDLNKFQAMLAERERELALDAQ